MPKHRLATWQLSLFLLLRIPLVVTEAGGTRLNDLFTKHTMIAHPETGLFADYVGLYTPAETVIHNTAIFPMTTATCHFLPLAAAEKIPSCNVTSKRPKRALGALIALGVGLLTLGTSTSSMLLTMNLQKEVTKVESILHQLSGRLETHGTHLLRLNTNQIELAEYLETTQEALDAVVPSLEVHNTALNRLAGNMERLKHQFQHSFLYTAITRIFRHDLTLEFFASDDLHKVVYDIVQRGNLTFNAQYGSLPLVQIITKLLVRQQIDFIPHSPRKRPTTTTAADAATSPTDHSTTEIGRLVITSFFGIPHSKQAPFQVYKLLAIPFFRHNETVQLAGIPKYWAINLANNSTIEWDEPTGFACDLQLMTTCRDTPPIRKLLNHTCFDQIMGNHAPSKCYTTVASMNSYFVQQLRSNLWITSSPASLHCLRMSQSDYFQHTPTTWNLNEHIVLPPVAVVDITQGSTIACPGFALVGQPKESNNLSLKIIYNNSFLIDNRSVVNVHEYLNQTTAWLARKPSKLQTDEMRHSLAQQQQQHSSLAFPDPPTSANIHIWLFAILIFSLVLFGVVAAFRYQLHHHRPGRMLRNPLKCLAQ